MPVAGELECRYAVHVMLTGRHAQAAVRVIYRIRKADVHAAKRVDHLDEAEEVHLDVVVDGEPGGLLDGLHHQLRTAEAEGTVDLVHAAPGYVHPRIARQADNLDKTR